MYDILPLAILSILSLTSLGNVENKGSCKVVDIGTVCEGTKISRVLELHNTTNETVKITGMSGCGCIKIGSYSKTIDPNSCLDLPLEIDTIGRQGAFRQSLRIAFDKIAPDTYHFIGEVVRTHPKIIDLGKFSKTQIVKKTFDLNSLETPEFEVESLECDTEGFCVSSTQDSKTSQTVVLVTTKKDLPFRGIFNKILSITTNAPDLQNCKVQIKGYVWQNVEIDKTRVFLSINSKEVEILRLYSPYGEDISSVETRISCSNVSVELVKRTPSEWLIAVSPNALKDTVNSKRLQKVILTVLAESSGKTYENQIDLFLIKSNRKFIQKD